MDITLDKSQNKEMKPFEQEVLVLLEPIVDNYVNLPHATTNVMNGINLDDVETV